MQSTPVVRGNSQAKRNWIRRASSYSVRPRQRVRSGLKATNYLQTAASNDRQRYWFFIHYQTVLADNAIRQPVETRQQQTIQDKLAAVEAVLFLSPEGISSRKMAKLAGLADATEARTLLRKLNQDLDESGRSYRVEENASGYALMTRSQFAPWLRRLSHIPGELRLSQTALETLAVVAYRQPVLRANIEAIRGVGCSEVLKQLMEIDLVRISGRSEDLGRPYLYGTTSRFLQTFGLRSADRLPRIDWVNAPLAPEASPHAVDNGSERKESSMNMTFSTTELEDHPASEELDPAQTVTAAIDDDDDEFFDDDDEFEDEDDDGEDDAWDDDDDDDEDDDEVAGDKDEEDDDDDEEEEEEEGDGGWVEVKDDDDDDWDDDDDEDSEDDDWEKDDDEDDDDWD